ncbi:hypothetical protein ACFYXQ_40605 [Nocardia jiangxiensis]|uniref:Uncharacterized protein n=1 Tax=Nocardia jiangxiensis TaxID=282685 RepID=A0ABW6SCM0_9NOCA
MGRTPPNVMRHELDLLWQNIFTWTSWAIVAVMLIIALRMCLRQRTPFYILACLAAGVAAFAEPLYDVAFDLWFYDVHNGKPGAMYSHFTAFGVVQPNWTHSGYIILYSSACIYVGRRIYAGRLNRIGLLAVWVAEIITSCIFEIVGTGTNVYTYYGPYELRIWNYPLAIGVLEGTQVIFFTVLAVQIWRHVSTRWGLLSLFPAFPITMFGANFGIGSPLIIALHLSGPTFSSGIVWAATALTLTLCSIAVIWAGKFLPKPPSKADPDGEPTPHTLAAAI